jgi:predicted nucleotidyltransferase
MEKEYRQAKLKAAANLGVHVLPSNLEVALELDKVAQETEGSARTERLIQMRTEALTLMKALSVYCPVLIGSVWRGTIRRGSDIDIEVFHDTPEEVVTALGAAGLKIQKIEQMTTTEHGKTGTSLHIHGESTQKNPVEIVVRAGEEKGKRRKCDTYGDEIKGLTIQQLGKLLIENSSKQFLPE